MDKVPKRLWIDPDYIDNDCASLEQTVVNDTQYIRADLVDELVGALESCIESEPYMDIDGDWIVTQRFDSKKVKAALEKIKEEE